MLILLWDSESNGIHHLVKMGNVGKNGVAYDCVYEIPDWFVRKAISSQRPFDAEGGYP